MSGWHLGPIAKVMITLSAFSWVPDYAHGLERDIRVRWALEEAGLPYRERLITRTEAGSAAYRAWQPFGQVPAIEQDGLMLFESGAIVQHIGETAPVLLPADPAARARARMWMFAALNTIEPPLKTIAEIDLTQSEAPWAAPRRAHMEALARRRLGELEQCLSKPYLEGVFTGGDLLMGSVLRIVRHTPLVQEWPRLAAYLDRCEARPAFRKALADQLATFEAHRPLA